VAIRRLGLFAVLIALLAPVTAQCQSDPTLWRFVYPNAKALVSINLQRIRQSPAVATIRGQWAGGKLTTILPDIGMLNDVDRILISSPGNQTTNDTGAESAEPPMLIAVHGHFDGGKVRQFFSRLDTKAQTYNSFQVYRPQSKGDKNMAYLLFDPETILMGDAPSVFAALDRNQFGPPTPPSGSIVARAAEMEAAYELWVVMNQPALLANDRFAGLIPGGDIVSDAQGLEAGLSLRSGLAADITVHFASEASAKQVVTEMAQLIAEASKDKSAAALAQGIAKKLRFTTEGSAAKISLRLTPQELEKSAQAFTAGYKAGAASQAAVPSPAAAPAPAKPGVIHIEGLDDGPREIPYPDRQR
jgi:hypothetical protein